MKKEYSRERSELLCVARGQSTDWSMTSRVSAVTVVIIYYYQRTI